MSETVYNNKSRQEMAHIKKKRMNIENKITTIKPVDSNKLKVG